ncbi:MAG: hypothetical protein IPL90_11115 [Holophagales bacterium]|nr:hypothetical protein [Holophagales bacterium]
MQKERVILYLAPQHSAVLVGLVLGERAAQSAEAGSLPSRSGCPHSRPRSTQMARGIRISAASHAQIEVVQALVPYKLLAGPPPPPGSP